MMAMMAKIPVFDPVTPQEAKDIIALAYQVSEEFEIPVMVRSTTRISHARQGVVLQDLSDPRMPSGFAKDPHRWAATPKYRLQLHLSLNKKVDAIRDKYGPSLFSKVLGNGQARQCIISSGVAIGHTYDLINQLNLQDQIALYQVEMPYPLEAGTILRALQSFEGILVIEETYPLIEMQLAMRDRIKGRMDGSVPPQGELVPDVLEETILKFAGLPGKRRTVPSDKARRPTLCSGCGHRPAFFAIRRAFPKGIYPSDIGCYTLGLNLGAVDTCLCMGSAVSQAAGFYHAHKMAGEVPPIVATIGDSTFYHAGVPPLINAVQPMQGSFCDPDNLHNSHDRESTHSGNGDACRRATGQGCLHRSLVKACGVEDVKIIDPYNLEEMVQA
jgi:indolepyruvate ferredoxin oxidoreductase alpha subunit